MDESARICLKIAVPLPVQGTFSYLPPAGETFEPAIGCRAIVPFRGRAISGYILEHSEQFDHEGLKAVKEILDDEPLFPESMVPFFEWVSEYYQHPIGQVIQSALPGGLKTASFKTARITEKGLRVLERIHSRSAVHATLSWVRDNPGKRLPWPAMEIYPLKNRRWLEILEGNPQKKPTPLVRKFVTKNPGVNPEDLSEGSAGMSGAAGEREFLEFVFSSGPLLLSELKEVFRNAPYLTGKWEKKGVLKTFHDIVVRDPSGRIRAPEPAPFNLFDQQKNTLDQIKGWLDTSTFHAALLYGVTGSGKTEVYIRASAHAIASGRQVIFMLPEIALARYMEGVFRSRLGERIAVYHSGLSGAERYEEWMRMVRGEVDLVIGARSALFSPLADVGLIIVDEEHDHSYKQQGNPRYQARDSAVVRARIHHAVAVLGSGTPSVQSYQNSREGRYHLLTMPERVEQRRFPEVEIIDMKILEEQGHQDRMLTPALKTAIEKNLGTGDQSLIFLNRRGFHRLFLCRACGSVLRCPNCDVSLIYHLHRDRLSCHFCGFSTATTIKCPSCGQCRYKAYGFGTERLEHELAECFPSARVARMDADSTRKKGRISEILKKFADHELDLLVGTQMITKGYDFPRVTLVGVIAADLSLDFPDFRGGERTFQLLSQVAGRAGRGEKPGRVLVQTFSPGHYAVRAAIENDYDTFFKNEIALRRELRYPPFSHLAFLRFQGNSRDKTEKAAHGAGRRIRETLRNWPKMGGLIQVLGPAEAPIPRLKGKYRWQILIKSRSKGLMHHLLNHAEGLLKKNLESVPETRGVRVTLDVDPYHMI